MNSWWKDAVRTLIISPEVLWAVFVGALAVWKPTWLLAVGEAFLAKDLKDAWPLLAVPFSLVGVAYPLSGKILRPTEKRLVLREWSEYWRLRLRVHVALLFCLIGAIAVVLGWVLFKNQHVLRGSTLAAIGMGVTVIALITVVLALQTTADIVEGFSPPS